MHSLVIASSAGLYKYHVAHLMKLARILLYYKIDNVRTSIIFHSEGSGEFEHLAQIQKVLPLGV